jgi:uncharacterized protein with FMN-binding domain
MKRRYKVAIVIGIVLVILFILGLILNERYKKDLDKLILMEITDVDLTKVADGDYNGSYTSFPLFAEVKVTIENHIITDITLLNHDNGQGEKAEVIPDKVIEAQSLEVECISGATYSSKVILKAIQAALLKGITQSNN